MRHPSVIGALRDAVFAYVSRRAPEEMSAEAVAFASACAWDVLAGGEALLLEEAAAVEKDARKELAAERARYVIAKTRANARQKARHEKKFGACSCGGTQAGCAWPKSGAAGPIVVLGRKRK